MGRFIFDEDRESSNDLFFVFQKSQDLIYYALGCKQGGIEVEIRIFTCVGHPALLFEIVLHGPIHFPAITGFFKGCIQEYQDIGVGDTSPHILDVGVLLGNVPCLIPSRS